MTILVDPPKWPAHGMLWGHLVSDESLDEFVAAGAQLVSSHELMTRLIASGLRARKTRS